MTKCKCCGRSFAELMDQADFVDALAELGIPSDEHPSQCKSSPLGRHIFLAAPRCPKCKAVLTSSGRCTVCETDYPVLTDSFQDIWDGVWAAEAF